MARAHANPNLDKRMYQIVFSGGEVAEMTANVIAKTVGSLLVTTHQNTHHSSELSVIRNSSKKSYI